MPVKRSVTPTAKVLPVKLTVTRKVYGDETEEETQLEVRKFEVEPAYVMVKAGMTRSLGVSNSYEFLRVDVSINVPCYLEDIDETAVAAGEKVANLLSNEIEKYMESENA